MSLAPKNGVNSIYIAKLWDHTTFNLNYLSNVLVMMDIIFLTSQKSCVAHTCLLKWSPIIFLNICVIIHSSFIDENKLTRIILSHLLLLPYMVTLITKWTSPLNTHHDNLPHSTKMLVLFNCLLHNSFVSDHEAIESVGECWDWDFDIPHCLEPVLDFIQKKSWFRE
jgi:hypothetical protein